MKRGVGPGNLMGRSPNTVKPLTAGIVRTALGSYHSLLVCTVLGSVVSESGWCGCLALASTFSADGARHSAGLTEVWGLPTHVWTYRERLSGRSSFPRWAIAE